MALSCDHATPNKLGCTGETLGDLGGARGGTSTSNTARTPALTSQPITCDTDIVDAERISVTMEEEGLGQ